MAGVLIMIVALNTQGLSSLVNDAGSTAFVKSLWTETGIQNPKAVFTIFFIGFLWVLFIMVTSRLIPPFRTARGLVSKALLPTALIQMANLLDVKKKMVFGPTIDGQLSSMGQSAGDHIVIEEVEEPEDAHQSASVGQQRENEEDASTSFVERVWQIIFPPVSADDADEVTADENEGRTEEKETTSEQESPIVDVDHVSRGEEDSRTE